MEREAMVRSYPARVQAALAVWEAEKLSMTEQARRGQRASVEARLRRRGARTRAEAAQLLRRRGLGYLLDGGSR